MKRRHVVMGLALILAGYLAFGAGESPAPPRKSVAIGMQSPRSPGTGRTATASKPEASILAIQPRAAWGDSAEEPLFAKQSWAPPPPPPSRPPPPPPPRAPAFPFAYVGKKYEEGQWEAYLARGNQVIVVREQGIVDNVYRVESIRPAGVSLMYLPLKQVQTLVTGGSE